MQAGGCVGECVRGRARPVCLRGRLVREEWAGGRMVGERGRWMPGCVVGWERCVGGRVHEGGEVEWLGRWVRVWVVSRSCGLLGSQVCVTTDVCVSG